jgi:hypothetical protein
MVQNCIPSVLHHMQIKMLPPSPALSDLNGSTTVYVALTPDFSFESNGVAGRGRRMVDSLDSELRSLGTWKHCQSTRLESFRKTHSLDVEL